MNITIIAVGKIKEKFYKSAIEEYCKRLQKYCNLKIIEVSDEKAPEELSQAQMEQVKEKEGERIISKIPNSSVIISLEIDGKEIDSVAFARKIEDFALRGKSSLCFIIGGSLGLSDSVKVLSNMRLSFSEMTFPHQLFRVMLLEQIYRGFRINRGEPYHK